MNNYQKSIKLYGKALQRKSKSLLSRAAWKMQRQSRDLSSLKIIVNSLPKSGTHLLMQIAVSLPDTKNFGSFIAERPSYSKRIRNSQQINRRLQNILPGEIVGAHLPFSTATADKIVELDALHLFTYRDPRAVIMSEIKYLVEMAPWNILHKRFAEIQSEAARIDLAIFGDGTPELPSAKLRYQPFYDWIGQPNVLSFNFDDLISTDKLGCEVNRLLDVFDERYRYTGDRPRIKSFIENIRPGSSHTFTSEDPYRWKKLMSKSQVLEVETQLEHLIEKFER